MIVMRKKKNDERTTRARGGQDPCWISCLIFGYIVSSVIPPPSPGISVFFCVDTEQFPCIAYRDRTNRCF